MNYATLGKRFVGAIIDSVMISIISTAVLILGGPILGFVTSAFTGVIYTVLMQGSSWHATLGQRAFNMAVVDRNGRGIDYGTALLRWFSSILSSVIFGIGYIIALFNNESQTLHDKMAGTYVVEGAVAISSGAATGGGIMGITGEKAGASIPIYGNGLMIGRDAAVCQVVLSRTNGISRYHCFVSYNPASGLYIISDKGSTNGTYTASGVRIEKNKSIALKRGERFYVGSRENMFEVM